MVIIFGPLKRNMLFNIKKQHLPLMDANHDISITCLSEITPNPLHKLKMPGFWNLESNTLNDVKTTGKYWLNFVVLALRDENKMM